MAPNTRTAVALRAIDWGIQAEQLSERTDFDLARGDLIGYLVSEDDEKIVVTMQWFHGAGVRCTLAVPKVCISFREDFVISFVDAELGTVPNAE